jgi:hypothetical protein
MLHRVTRGAARQPQQYYRDLMRRFRELALGPETFVPDVIDITYLKNAQC